MGSNSCSTNSCSGRCQDGISRKQLKQTTRFRQPGLFMPNGESGIRTHGTRKGPLAFEASSFGHSDTSPENENNTDFEPARE